MKKTKYLFLENVARILILQSGQRGRDFSIILQSLNELGYAVEWRFLIAADFGISQRRRKIFILAYLRETNIYESIKEVTPTEWILELGTLAEAFPVTLENILFQTEFNLKRDIVSISENFNKGGTTGVFENTGLMINGLVTTLKTQPNYDEKFTILRNVIQNGEVTSEFYIDKNDPVKWAYLKEPKKEMRTNAQGFENNYSEGRMILNLGFTPKGPAIRSNLSFVPQKRISTTIPNAKISAQ